MSRKSSQVEKPEHVTVSTGDARVLLFLHFILLLIKAAESRAAPSQWNTGEPVRLFEQIAGI